MGIETRQIRWILDADISAYFDTIDHDWLFEFLRHRAAHTLDGGSPVHSFATLLAELSTLVRNTCRAPGTTQNPATFQATTLPSPKQQRALELIQHLHL